MKKFVLQTFVNALATAGLFIGAGKIYDLCGDALTNYKIQEWRRGFDEGFDMAKRIYKPHYED